MTDERIRAAFEERGNWVGDKYTAFREGWHAGREAPPTFADVTRAAEAILATHVYEGGAEYASAIHELGDDRWERAVREARAALGARGG